MKDFKVFIQEQGVVGLAVGFILGGAVSALVAGFVEGLVNPVIAWLFDTGNLEAQTSQVGEATLAWGNVVALFINFIVVAAVVYFGVKKLGLDKLDKEKK